MINIKSLLFGRQKYPSIPNLAEGNDDFLHLESLTRGTLVLGRPGSGKTVWGAMVTMSRALANPEYPIFVLDASGSFCDEFIKLTYQLPPHLRERIEDRLIYDRMGDPEYVTALPFFSPNYGLYPEEQVQRVTANSLKLNDDLVLRNPTMGGIAIGDIAAYLYRLLISVEDQNGHSWQITEARDLLLNTEKLSRICKKFGHKEKGAQEYFYRHYLPLTETEMDKRTYTFRSILGKLDPKPIRARVGYHTPSWTPKEAIEKGQIVLVSGEELITQPEATGILFTDVYSQIIAAVNKRTPHDETEPPILIVIDEVPMLLEIKGMAEEIGKVSPRYRSRKLQIMIIIQMLSQLEDSLRDKIWSLGNTACFGLDSHKESYEVAQQLFSYDPSASKKPMGMKHLIADPDRAQYLVAANWIQHFSARSLVLKRWIDEGTEEKYVQFIERTTDKPNVPLLHDFKLIKRQLLKKNALEVSEALKVVNSRTLTNLSGPPQV